MEEILLIGFGALVTLILVYRLLVRYTLLKLFQRQSDSQMQYVIHHPDCKVKGRFDP